MCLQLSVVIDEAHSSYPWWLVVFSDIIRLHLETPDSACAFMVSRP